jgi:ABC-type polysaccharide/polyol phosphate transport system ATPase subunit
MLSETLIEGVGLSKSYAHVTKPVAVLVHALFPALFPAPKGKEVIHAVDLSILRGETVGIVGRNGAGKTTLLGLLGGVLEPSSGTVKHHCKVATLLGLSAGFNSNFSGRENAVLFCAIYNIPRAATESIVLQVEDFAELGEYFELPLRTYSSGMQARLSFACAIHVSADLIIIDETLAVGDASFKLKCYDRIKKMQAEGQSFLLVSHSQNLIANYCTRAIVLDDGRKVFDGHVLEALQIYKNIRSRDDVLKSKKVLGSKLGGKSSNEIISISDVSFRPNSELSNRAEVSLRITSLQRLERPRFSWGLRTSQGIIVANAALEDSQSYPSICSRQAFLCTFSFEYLLNPGKYFFSLSVYELVEDVAVLVSTLQNAITFDVPGSGRGGIVDLSLKMSVRSLEEL